LIVNLTLASLLNVILESNLSFAELLNIILESILF